MSVNIITVDSKGLISDPEAKIQWILSHLIATEASQSNLHRFENVSLVNIIRQAGNDKLLLRELMEQALKKVFDKFYDSSQVSIITKDNPDDVSRFDLLVTVKVKQDNKWYDVADTLIVDHEKIQKLTSVSIT